MERERDDLQRSGLSYLVEGVFLSAYSLVVFSMCALIFYKTDLEKLNSQIAKASRIPVLRE